jgi:hypothetical protein
MPSNLEQKPEQRVLSELSRIVAAEFVMPAFSQDRQPAVALYGRGWREEFCIPVATEEEASMLATRLQELFVACIERYETLRG